MEQAEEAAAEAEAQSDGTFRLIDEGGVVELELGQIGLEVFVVGGVDRDTGR